MGLFSPKPLHEISGTIVRIGADGATNGYGPRMVILLEGGTSPIRICDDHECFGSYPIGLSQPGDFVTAQIDEDGWGYLKHFRNETLDKLLATTEKG